MLHSYQAQLQGNQMTWIGVPPPPRVQPRRVPGVALVET